jgi:hypothetical protein
MCYAVFGLSFAEYKVTQPLAINTRLFVQPFSYFLGIIIGLVFHRSCVYWILKFATMSARAFTNSRPYSMFVMPYCL